MVRKAVSKEQKEQIVIMSKQLDHILAPRMKRIKIIAKKQLV